MFTAIIVASVVGAIISFYAFAVEKRLNEQRKNYKAMCDINDRISCTRAFSSKYGKLFGASNSLFGIFFYLAVILFSILEYGAVVFALSAASILLTFYLAYISYVKMKNFCIVCSAVYLVNLLIFIFALYIASDLIN